MIPIRMGGPKLLVKEAISTELLSLDRSKTESMFKEIQAIRSKVPSKEQAN